MWLTPIVMTISLFTCFQILGQANIESEQDSLPLIPNRFFELSNIFPEYCFVKGSVTSKMIVLTFDDGPSFVTEKVLDILESHGAKATFFWLGENLSKHQAIVDRTIHAGHEIGNHSWDHTNPNQFSFEALWNQQILQTNKAFDSLFGISPTLFRPPFGSISQHQIQFLKDKNIKTVLWSMTSLDWDLTQNSSEEIITRFKTHLHPGAVVLFHDVDFQNTHEEMLAALVDIIIYVKANNYRLGTLSELINDK